MRKIDDRTLTKSRKDEILKKYDYTCMYCFADADQVDHIIPWSYKHDDSEDNLVACCWLCNVVAHNKMFDTFKEKQDYIQEYRYKWIKKHPIPLWLKSEVDELGLVLRDKIMVGALVFDTRDERERVKRELMSEGFRVIVRDSGKK